MGEMLSIRLRRLPIRSRSPMVGAASSCT